MKRQKEPTLAEAAAQLDRRRQAQINRQIEIIDRLLTGDGYDEILRSQTDEIAKLRVENEDLKVKISNLLDPGA
jgi:cell division protein FtsB